MARNNKRGSHCTRCQWFEFHRVYSFRSLTRWGTFDVDAAEKIARDGRARKVMSLKSLARYARRDRWAEDRGVCHTHIPHVHPHKAIIFGTLRDAANHARHFLIEGHHRALRHLAEKRPVNYYLLTAAETDRITLRRRNRRRLAAGTDRAQPKRAGRRSPRAQSSGATASTSAR